MLCTSIVTLATVRPASGSALPAYASAVLSLVKLNLYGEPLRLAAAWVNRSAPLDADALVTTDGAAEDEAPLVVVLVELHAAMSPSDATAASPTAAALTIFT